MNMEGKAGIDPDWMDLILSSIILFFCLSAFIVGIAIVRHGPMINGGVDNIYFDFFVVFSLYMILAIISLYFSSIKYKISMQEGVGLRKVNARSYIEVILLGFGWAFISLAC